MKVKVWAEYLPAMQCWVWCFGLPDGTELGTRTSWADAIDAARLAVLKDELRKTVWTEPAARAA